MARLALLREGIPCEVVGDDLATSLSWFGTAVTKVDLLVGKNDVEQAGQILLAEDQQFFGHQHDQWGIDSRLGWVCENCDEVNDTTFDLCWSCKADRSPTALQRPLDEEPRNLVAGDAPVHSQDEDLSPYRAPMAISETTAFAEDLVTANRVYRAAILSLYFPPLTLYTVYLLWKCYVARQMTPQVWTCAVMIGFLLTGQVVLLVMMFLALL